MKEKLRHDVFRGLAKPKTHNMGAKRQFKIGDSVFLNFGESGKVGPCKIDALLEYEDDDGDSFEGYSVTFPVDSERDFGMGFLSPDWLIPA